MSCGKIEKKTKIIANFEGLYCWTGILRMQFPTPYGIALLEKNGPELLGDTLQFQIFVRYYLTVSLPV